jgi:lipopolysaccharide assembly outer membrane protein LptD (OstA)
LRGFVRFQALLLVALALGGACLAPPARADVVAFGKKGGKNEPYDITADSVEYDKERDLYVAKGNVRIQQPGRTLTADWMTFSNKTRQAVASGNVVMVEGGDTLRASFVEFHLDSFEGVVFDGNLDARTSSFRMTGEEVQRTGENTYTFHEGRFTTCRCPQEGDRDPWSIRAEEADLEVGGYGTARNTTFDVLGVPVIWLPWMVYPLKTDRQSGFLLPNVTLSSRSGFGVGVPYFWAIGDQMNLVTTPEYLLKRGLKGNLGGEYVFGKESEGRFAGAFIHDKTVSGNNTDTPFGPNRWWFNVRSDYHLPDDWRWVSNVQMVSDNSYPSDFNDISKARSDRYLTSESYFGRSFLSSGRLGVAVSGMTGDDLQNPDDSDRDAFMFQRLPNVDVNLLPMPITPALGLVATSGANYTFFTPWKIGTRKLPSAIVSGPGTDFPDGQFLDTGFDASPDSNERGPGGIAGVRNPPPPGSPPGTLGPFIDANGDDFDPANGNFGPEGDGKYEEGEPLNDRGSRLLLTPRLGYPTRLFELLEVYPEIGYREALYDTQRLSFEENGFLTGRVDLRTRIRGQFSDPFGGGRVTHLIEPRIGYAIVQQTSQRNDPLFVPKTAFPQDRLRQFDLDNVTLDSADRVDDFNGVTAGFANRFYGTPEGGLTPRLLGDVRFSSEYDFSHGDFGNLYVDGTAYPGTGTYSRFILGFDPRKVEVSEGLLEAGWFSLVGHDFTLTYRYLRDIPQFFENFRFAPDRFRESRDNFSKVNQISAYTRVALTRSWAVTYNVGYSFSQSFLLGNQVGVEYLSKCRCWAVRLEGHYDRTRGFTYNLLYRIVGLGDDTVRPFWGGGSGSGFLGSSAGNAANAFLDDPKSL